MRGMKTAAIAVVGFVLVIAGIALLVLPGPGFVVIAAGLAVLSTRFDWAHGPLNFAKARAKQGIKEVRHSRLKAAFALLAALALIAIGALHIAGIRVPLVSTVTAVTLIISGLIAVGSVLWARHSSRAGRSLL